MNVSIVFQPGGRDSRFIKVMNFIPPREEPLVIDDDEYDITEVKTIYDDGKSYLWMRIKRIGSAIDRFDVTRLPVR